MSKKEVKKVFSVRLSPKMIKDLKESAKKTGKTIGDLIRSTLKKETN